MSRESTIYNYSNITVEPHYAIREHGKLVGGILHDVFESEIAEKCLVGIRWDASTSILLVHYEKSLTPKDKSILDIIVQANT